MVLYLIKKRFFLRESLLVAGHMLKLKKIIKYLIKNNSEVPWMIYSYYSDVK